MACIGCARPDGEIDQRRTGEVERREEIEIPGEAKAVGDRRRDQPADKVAGDIAGDVRGKCAAGVHRAALLAEIGEGEREGGCHAQALRDPQGGEDRKIGRAAAGRGHRLHDKVIRMPRQAIEVGDEEADHEAGRSPCPWCGLTAKPIAAGETRSAASATAKFAAVANRSTTVGTPVSPMTRERSAAPGE
jgi:hypothetical protein